MLEPPMPPSDFSTLTKLFEKLKVEHKALTHEYQRLLQCLNLAPIYFYVLDYSGQVLMVNQKFAEFYMGEIKDLVGKNMRDIHSDKEQAAQMIRDIQSVIDSGEPKIWRDLELTDPQGQLRIADLYDIPFVDIESGEPRLLGIGIDLSERKELEARKVAQERIERDLAIARNIQRRLLPDTIPSLSHFDIAGWSEAADHTGGDYFDWMPLPDRAIICSLADVSGHGLGPAIIAAYCRAYVRATFKGHVSLGQSVEHLNDLLCDDLPPGQFVTFVAVRIDSAARRAELVSAGQGPILFYCADTDEVKEWPANGAPLGIVRGQKFDTPRRITFCANDALFLMSDGFFELKNGLGEQFGLTRLKQRVANAGRARPPLKAAQLIEQLRAAVYAHAGQTKQLDDMTAVVVRSREGLDVESS